ncbi:MAG: hypothetical protein NC324_07400 [Bacteroides sp.]|nr:hypothetical protein [Bacteroides sp.]
MSIDETIQWFKDIFELNSGSSGTKEQFRIGATEDIEKYKEQHPEISLLGVTKCDTRDTVQALLDRMHSEGFPSEGTDNNPLFVYLRKN